MVFCSKKAVKEKEGKMQGHKNKKEEKQKSSRTKGWRRGCVETEENVSHVMCLMHQDQAVDRKRIEELKE